MSLLKMSGVILAAYLAAGRTGLVAACLFLGISPLTTLMVALLVDIVQMPVYGVIIEISNRHIVIPERARSWIDTRKEKIQGWIRNKRRFTNFPRFQPFAVVAVSTIPFRGFGIFSACILAFFLGYRRLEGTLLVMIGSLIGAVASILIFYYPARWFNAF